MEENVKTSIKIAGRIYPIFVHKDEMAKAKMLEKQINDTYNDIQMQYAINDKFDCLSMTLLTLLSDKKEAVSINRETEDLLAILSSIETSLSKANISH
jgi:Cell division protein ZapA